MKTFVKDYVELWKHSNDFLKKHWKGYIALCAALGVASYAPAYIAEKKRQKEYAAKMEELLKEMEEELA